MGKMDTKVVLNYNDGGVRMKGIPARKLMEIAFYVLSDRRACDARLLQVA